MTTPRQGCPSEILDRVPPHSLDAEKSVLGSIILDPGRLAEVQAIVRPADFYADAHRRVYSHLCGLNGNGSDPIALAESLLAAGELEAAGGLAYLAELARSVPVAGHAAYHAKIVRKHSDARQLRDIALHAVQDVYLGKPAQEIKTTLLGDLDDVVASDQSSGFDLLTCEGIMASDVQTRFLIDHVLVEGQPCILAGPMKCMKTSLLIDAALSIATGGYFLGKFPVTHTATVALMSAESGMATIKETIGRVSRAAGIDPHTIKNFYLCDTVPRLASLDHLDRLDRLIVAEGITVLMLDPLYMALTGENQSNLSAQGMELRGITELAQKHRLTLILADHARKGAAIDYSPLELSAITGAGKGEYTRQWILLNRREAYTPGTGSHRLWLSVGGSAGHSGRWGLDIEEGTIDTPGGRFWQVDVPDCDDVRQTEKQQREAHRQEQKQEAIEQDKRQLAGIMAKLKAPDSKRAIRDAAGLGNGQRFEAAWSGLVADGAIVQDGTIQKGNKQTYEAYKLADE